MAELLTADQVAAALESLPGWSGDTERIRRVVRVEAETQDALVDEVMRVADTLDHHPTMERGAGSLTFLVWTHSAGGVTSKDVELAARIDEVLSGRDVTE